VNIDLESAVAIIEDL